MNIVLNILLSFVFGLIFHDVPVSDFSLIFSDRYIDLEIQLEKSDLQNELKINPIHDEDLFGYLNANFNVNINGVSIVFDFCDLKRIQGHYYVQGQSELPSITDEVFVSISNTCLLKTINQTNNLFIHFNENLRGFKMDKSRTEIKVNL